MYHDMFIPPEKCQDTKPAVHEFFLREVALPDADTSNILVQRGSRFSLRRQIYCQPHVGPDQNLRLWIAASHRLS